MSLGLIMNIANSGLNTAQSQLRTVSDNVSNINTPGYVRKIADQQSLTTQAAGSGVEIGRVRLATDRFLQAATLKSGADAGRETVRYELYDRIQGLFGDPGGDTSFFTRIDSLFSVLASSAEMPTSGAARQDAVWKAQNVFDEASRVSSQVQAIREDADNRIQSGVENVNGLLDQIAKLNREIARSTVVGADATGAQNAQMTLINELSSFMDIRITNRSVGGVEIRTGAGLMLVSTEAGKLEYGRAGAISAQTSFNDIYVTEPNGGSRRSLTEGLESGEFKGLLQLRDVDAPAVAEQLSELTTRLADELNRAHNASTAFPPPSSLTGRNIGSSLEAGLTGFTGSTSIAVVSSSGMIQSRADIVFNGGTLTINGVASTPANFLADLNAAVPGLTASFENGQLKLEAAGGNGVAIADSEANPSTKAGRGFSHFFGMNDLVSSRTPALYDTGLTSTSQHGFAAGQSLSFRFTDANGARIRDVEFMVPAGADTMAGLVSALNDPVNGIGRHGTFALSSLGELTFTGRGNPPAQMSVLNDVTSQAASGVSMSALFGMGGARANRTGGFSIREDIARDPTRLALGQLDLNVVGAPALSSADGRGARKLAAAGDVTAKFGPAAGNSGITSTLSRYASDMAGSIGAKANLAQSAASSASALNNEALSRRSSFEGVNLEEELVLMTTYQQAFNASARMIQAAAEMYDTLLGMVR